MDRELLFSFENEIRNFEQGSGWRLSTPAKVVLQQAFLSLDTDYLGLAGYTTGESRREMEIRVVKNVGGFLWNLSQKAGSAALDQNLNSDEERLIGAIYIMQHMQNLAMKVNCGCWPRDPSV